MYSDPLIPGLWWRDDSPEDDWRNGGLGFAIQTIFGKRSEDRPIGPWTHTIVPSNHQFKSFIIDEATVFERVQKNLQNYEIVSLGAVTPSNHSPGTLGPFSLTEWQDQSHSGQDDDVRLPVCPAHGTLPRSGLCRKCVRGR